MGDGRPAMSESYGVSVGKDALPMGGCGTLVKKRGTSTSSCSAVERRRLAG